MSYVLDEEAAEVTEFGALACFSTRLVPDRKRPHVVVRGLNHPGVQFRFGLLMHWVVTVNLDPPLRNVSDTPAFPERPVMKLSFLPDKPARGDVSSWLLLTAKLPLMSDKPTWGVVGLTST